jgi:thiamine pyrophosphate-dependent acetolactate synthase large subunit-like protein
VKVTDAIADALAKLGADTMFGVVGSGNFHLTNALISRGVRYVAARHECGAASMADAWARLAGRPALLTLHQGPGLTNALTGITEAAKSRTPLLVLAADVSAGAVTSNFRIDVSALAGATEATAARLHSPAFALDDAVRAYRTARDERRTVVLGLPLDVQASECTWPGDPELRVAEPSPPSQPQVAKLAAVLAEATRPVFVAGRGARSAAARAALEQLGRAAGDIGGGEGPVPGQSMGPGRQRRVRVTADGRADRERRRARRLGLLAEHVDHAARHADQPPHDRRSGGQ